MKLKVLSLSLLVLSSLSLLYGCTAADACAILIAAGKAGYQVGENHLGVATPAEPDWQALLDNCKAAASVASTDPDPGIWTASVQPAAGICAKPYEGTNPCAACVRSKCCAEAVACAGGQTCICNLAPSFGVTWPAEVPCADPDAAYQAVAVCLDQHCGEECSP